MDAETLRLLVWGMLTLLGICGASIPFWVSTGEKRGSTKTSIDHLTKAIETHAATDKKLTEQVGTLVEGQAEMKAQLKHHGECLHKLDSRLDRMEQR